ncbi:MAG: TIGR00266 family protein [Actinobacteria bacterium]|nr:TIGR00266 family protein [Actinomycetota bacterium]
MDAQIKGTTLPVLEMQLNPGEKLVAEAGELSWMTQSIQLTTTTQTAGAKGMMGVLKRAVGGGGIFMTEYEAQGSPGTVAFATKLPGQILPIKVSPGNELMIQRHGFLCATEGVELTMAFQKKLGAGIFGGEGFVLQKLGGSCDAWLELDGEVVIYDLQPGEFLRVHPGHVGMFQAQMAFEITTVPGIKNKLFGGDGLFLAKLTGPGRLWLQTLPIANLAQALQPYLVQGEVTAGGAGGVIGGAIGGIFGNS